MRLLAFGEWRVVVPRAREKRRWWLQADHHKAPTRLIDHVRAKRVEEGVTMKELARKLGVSHGGYKYWEMHKCEPLPKSRKLLVRYLGYDPEPTGAAANA